MAHQLELDFTIRPKRSEVLKGLAKDYASKWGGGRERWEKDLNESLDNLVRHSTHPDGGFCKFDKMFGNTNKDLAIRMASNQIVALYAIGRENGWG